MAIVVVTVADSKNLALRDTHAVVGDTAQRRSPEMLLQAKTPGSTERMLIGCPAPAEIPPRPGLEFVLPVQAMALMLVGGRSSVAANPAPRALRVAVGQHVLDVGALMARHRSAILHDHQRDAPVPRPAGSPPLHPRGQCGRREHLPARRQG